MLGIHPKFQMISRDEFLQNHLSPEFLKRKNRANRVSENSPEAKDNPDWVHSLDNEICGNINRYQQHQQEKDDSHKGWI